MSYSKSRKRSIVEILDNEEKEYRFHVLLPNGTSTRIILRDPGNEMLIDDFVHTVREEYERVGKRLQGESRSIFWNGEICVEDMSENKFRKRILFRCFRTNKWNMIRLHDGTNEIIDTFQNMWDLTPDTDLLSELPAEYTFETALADLIDNSLQAVWSNGVGDRRIISVTINEHGILIFDSGPGMDASDDNSIVKWGKMGSSNHRPSRGFAIGGKPPYLMPFFGMFGYGGPIASMHLGRSALVSSKTKESKKVYILHLAREALLNNSSSERIWRTAGGIRGPSEEEIEKSPHGSFTQVEIQDLKLRCPETFQLQCRLKDIYFPYIQSDDLLSTGKTSTPIEFQVNGVNLAEIEGGEVAITNLHSCNGPDFVLQLRFLNKQNIGTSRCPGSRGSREANARLKCIYFPIVEGEENINRILEKLEDERCGVLENFENFCRVSIRRLGRLLPDARWRGLPFMEARHKKGDKAQLLKRCCWRVKCFVETDAGFSPTPSKTDLAHHDPFTIALRNFGHKSNGKESETTIEIYKDGTIISLTQLEKEYHDWISQMHDGYDEEIDCGEDQPVLVVSPSNKKGLGISADVVRVHRVIRRKGESWKSGQKIIILKGAVGCSKNNLYATLEYILLEGFQGDVGGEARLICRPLDCEVEKGCLLTVNGENATLDIRGSLSFPISVIDSGKCQAIDTATWNYQIEKRRQKAPATIDILNVQQCCQLEIDGPLPTNTTVSAGLIPPKEIVAVVRPASFNNSSCSKGLDQKYIVKGDLEMTMEITYHGEGKHKREGKFIYAERLKPSSRKGFHGLYIFPLASKLPNLFHKAGVYTFLFSVICTNSSCKKHEARVIVKPSTTVGKWELLRDGQIAFDDGSSLTVRIGSTIPHISVVCYDEYSNRTPFPSIPGVNIKIKTKGFILICVDKMMLSLSSNDMILEIKDILIESCELDKIRPHYMAKLEICSHDELFSVAVPCQVIPGPLSCVKMQRCPQLEADLLPGDVIQELVLELLDAYGNHVEKGVEIHLDVDGFRFQDCMGSQRKVDDQGYLNLSGLLKVAVGYGTSVYLSVFSDGKIFLKGEFQVVKRELRIISEVPAYCNAGSQLKNVIFGIFDFEGAVDEAIHGHNHTLTITSETLETDDTILYTFQHGKSTVPCIPVPQKHGVFRFVACHSHYPELQTSVEVSVMQAPKLELVSVTGSDVDVVPSQCLDGGLMLLQDSVVCGPTHMHTLAESIMSDEKKFQQDLAHVGLRIGNFERKLKMLNDQKAAIEQEIDDLRASMGPQSAGYFNHLIDAKEQIVKRIESKDDAAASVFYNLSKLVHSEENHYIQDVVGLVALLGTVNSDSLSRIFAEYLGENYMLALVCKSYKAASALEKYDKNGCIDRSRALHESAATMGKTIKRRFLVICLEEIRPYSGKVDNNDPQRKFVLPDPHLPSGNIPPGFLGYAVNMIDLDIHHLDTRISARYGLRETLFFLLFGELQVYRTREDMKRAFSCIKHGAVSLDGAIMKENGIISLGDWETEVRFPVVASGVKLDFSGHAMDIIKLIEDKNAELKAIGNEIAKGDELHAKAMKKFRKKSERLRKFMEEKEPFLRGYLLEYKPNIRPN